MTFSNGSYNPHPLANPFNTRIGYSNYTLNPNGQSYSRGFSSTCKDLPDPVMINNNCANQLHTPQINTPMFRLHELQGIIDDYNSGKQWDDREIYSLHGNTQLDRKSIEYWKNANKENEKLILNISDEQKKMLTDIELMFPVSKFVDE